MGNSEEASQKSEADSTDPSTKMMSDVEADASTAEGYKTDPKNILGETDFATQRYRLRERATDLCVRVIGGMAILLIVMTIAICAFSIYAFYCLESADVLPTSLMIALYVAPIVSITTLSLGLLVGVFRGYKSSDGEESASFASRATQMVTGNG